LDALFFLHFALFHPLHFFLPFLKGRCHSLTSLQSARRHEPGVHQLMQRARLPARFARLPDRFAVIFV
jgi:hypothetical protein